VPGHDWVQFGKSGQDKALTSHAVHLTKHMDPIYTLSALATHKALHSSTSEILHSGSAEEDDVIRIREELVTELEADAAICWNEESDRA
jgi:hypothetical protein